MDDLISRKAFLDDLCQDREEGTFEFNEKQVEAADKIVRYMFSRIEAQSSVPAVPLDKLCELLALHFGYPCQIIDDCSGWYVLDCAENETKKEDCAENKTKKEDCWRRALTMWMKGLDAAD